MMNHPANTVFVRVPSPSITSENIKKREHALLLYGAKINEIRAIREGTKKAA